MFHIISCVTEETDQPQVSVSVNVVLRTTAAEQHAVKRFQAHLIDVNSGRVIEFVDSDIEKLQEKIANKLGYKLMGHKLELYGVPLKKS